MSTPWPAPSAGDNESARGRRPNFALRRAVAASAVAVVAAGVVGIVVTRRGSDDDAAAVAIPRWDTVVTQDLDTGTITVYDREGAEVSTVATDLIGVSDVGTPGLVLLGNLSTSSTTGVGVLHLATGEIDELRMRTDVADGHDGEPFRVGYDLSTKRIELLDVVRSTVVDLLSFVDTDDPVVLPESVRVDSAGAHVAFSELKRSETLVVNLESSEAVTMPGVLVDLAFDSVVTLTNRGDTVLLDRYDLSGERTGTVEVIGPAALMLVDPTTAIAVSPDGTITRVDFEAESATDVGAVATGVGESTETTVRASADDSGAADGTDDAGSTAGITEVALITGGFELMDHRRLVVFGDTVVASVDGDGGVLGTTLLDEPLVPRPGVGPAQRCALFTNRALTASALIDAETGAAVAPLDGGRPVGQSDDGCTVALDDPKGDGTRLVTGSAISSLPGTIDSVSADATAALQVDAQGIAVVDLDSAEVTPLTAQLGVAVFAVLAER